MDWLKANVFTLVTAVIAVYGAVLATLNYRHARLEKKRRLKVELSGGFLTYGPGMGTSLSEYQCLVTVSNPGHTSVTLRSVHLSAGKLSVHFPPDAGEARLPVEIQPGRGLKFWVAAKDVASGLAEEGMSGKVKLRAVASDGTGESFMSDGVEFDINDLK